MGYGIARASALETFASDHRGGKSVEWTLKAVGRTQRYQ
ncbi:hypothetical protein PAMC26577_24235 [Caballeronia sordidicola]|uniref:Uncharacterized protein n=1 Tax=Caballeronia sordidicola TaxID=196367 RepID=A0A242MJT8_CABSO|nr:hypothetical protein PAMC26577_24235 [Caballeronia sordidicola]